MKKERNWFGIFVGAMIIAFSALLCLKIIGTMELSWFWVTAPLWVLGAIFLIIYVMYAIAISVHLDDDKKDKE